MIYYNDNDIQLVIIFEFGNGKNNSMARFFPALQFHVSGKLIPEWEFLEQNLIVDPKHHEILDYLICLDFWEMQGRCPVCHVDQLDLVEHYMIAHLGITNYEIGSDRECATSAILQENKGSIILNHWRCVDCGHVMVSTDPQNCDCYKGYFDPHLRHLRCPFCVQLIRVERFYAHYRHCSEAEFLEGCRFCGSERCGDARFSCGSVVYNAMKYVASRMQTIMVACPICWQTENIASYRTHFTKCSGVDVVEMNQIQIAEKWKLNYITNVKSEVRVGKFSDWVNIVKKRPLPKSIPVNLYRCVVCPESFERVDSLLLHFFAHRSQPTLWATLIEKALLVNPRLADVLLNADTNQLNALSLGQGLKFNVPPESVKTPTSESIKFSGTSEIPADTRIVFRSPTAPTTPLLLASEIPGDTLEEL